MNTFGLIGYPLQHSFSKKYFEEKFKREGTSSNNQYLEWPLKSIDELPRVVKPFPDLKGLNVTIPYKELVLGFLDELDELAGKIKSVNCVKVADGKWKGYNTDVTGLELSLQNFLTDKPGYAFVLGTGGSAKAVMFVLNKLNIPFSAVSTRNAPEYIRYSEIPGHMKGSNLFINATPLGTFPDTDASPEIPYSALTAKDFLFDLVYNPAETLFIKQGKAKGAQTKNGLEMLHIQADKSWEIWSSRNQTSE